MGDKSRIQWTDATWNPVTGCSKVSQGCKNCYALRDWPRVAAPRPTPNVYTGRAFTDVMFHPDRLDQPLRWAKPRRVFVNSMSDLFHEKVPDEAIRAVFSTMAQAPRHVFQILTKRPERMQSLLSRWQRDGLTLREGCGAVLQNVWLGTSVEDQAKADERIPLLLQTPAAVRFVSYEPALGPISFRWTPYAHQATGENYRQYLERVGSVSQYEALKKIDWLIVGGESGPGARPCDVSWIRSAVEQCKAAGVPVFVKQLGGNPQEIAQPAGVTDSEALDWMRDGWTRIFDAATNEQHWRRYMRLKDRKGGDPAEWPEDLRVREFPGVTP